MLPGVSGLVLLVVWLTKLATSSPSAWTIASSHPVALPGSLPAYWGFPFSLRALIPGGLLRVTVVCGSTAPPANTCIADNSYPGTGLDVYTVREQAGVSRTSVSGFSPGAIGKVLYQHGTRLFIDPETGRRYDGAIFYATQRVPGCAGDRCGSDGKWIAYTNDGIEFVGHRRIMADCSELSPPADPRCYDSSWWCDNGWPCDSAYPRSWWTEGDMAPLYVDGAFYALALSHQYGRPGYPRFSHPEIWTLHSADGNNWRRHRQVNPDNLDPRYFQRGCIRGPWMINPDIARDQSGTYYMTRSYSDNYAGCDVTLPNRVQVYSVRGGAGVMSGRWTKLVDLGCDDLGFQPDSAQILHDGLGKVVPGARGSVSLYVGISGADWTYSLCGGSTHQPGSCGAPPSHRVQEVTITP